MKDEMLMEVTRVVDDSTGNWRVGEIEWGVKTGIVKEYLKQYKAEGLEEIIGALAFLIHDTYRIYDGLKLWANAMKDKETPNDR